MDGYQKIILSRIIEKLLNEQEKLATELEGAINGDDDQGVAKNALKNEISNISEEIELLTKLSRFLNDA